MQIKRTAHIRQIQHWPTLIVCVVLTTSLALLAVSMAHVLHESQRHFERAAASQTQLAEVSRIEALVFEGDLPAQARALKRYMASIKSEMQSFGNDDGQQDELAKAAKLQIIASDPQKRSEVRALVAAIGAKERVESAQVAADMIRLRQRMGWVAAALIAMAAGSALLGLLGLLGANRRLSREIAARTADLDAVDRSRRLFFAKASHEMRTPVTVMRGDAEVALADRGADVDQLRDALRHVVANAEFLEHRIEELLGLSRAQDGQFALERAPEDLVGLARRVTAQALGYARSNDVTIEMDVVDGPLFTLGDGRWLGQALLAVLDNGIKFSPYGGSVRLTIGRYDGSALIEIADRGSGVIAEVLPRIFDAYYQGEVGRSRGGSGLGLALARWVVEQHGGTIRAVNDPAGGCTIRITLPLVA